MCSRLGYIWVINRAPWPLHFTGISLRKNFESVPDPNPSSIGATHNNPTRDECQWKSQWCHSGFPLENHFELPMETRHQTPAGFHQQVRGNSHNGNRNTNGLRLHYICRSQMPIASIREGPLVSINMYGAIATMEIAMVQQWVSTGEPLRIANGNPAPNPRWFPPTDAGQ